MISLLCLFIHIIWKILFCFYLLCKPFNKIFIWIFRFIGIWINKINYITIFFISIKNSFLIPAIHCFPAFLCMVIKSSITYPLWRTPTQKTNLYIWINLLCISCHNKSRRTRNICILIFITFCTSFCSS